jgi:hypothetical protein
VTRMNASNAMRSSVRNRHSVTARTCTSAKARVATRSAVRL